NVLTLTLQPGSENHDAPYDVTITATDTNSNQSQQTLTFQSNNPQGLVINGGFEWSEVTNAKDWEYPSSIPGWTLESGPNFELQENLFLTAAEGDQYAELDAHPSPGSMSMSQAIATEAGHTYELTFAFAGRPGTSLDENHLGVDLFSIDPTTGALTALDFTLLDDTGIAVTDNEPQLDPYTDPGWHYYTATFTATTAHTSLQFANLGPANTLGTFLDDVSVVEVPGDEWSANGFASSIYTRPINVELQTGNVILRADSGPDAEGLDSIQPTYRQTGAGNPIIQRTYTLEDEGAKIESIEATLTFNGVTNASSVTYDVSHLTTGDEIVISLQADDIDLDLIDSGRYEYSIELKLNLEGGGHGYADAEDNDSGGQADFSTTGNWTYDDSSPAAAGSYAGDTGTHVEDYSISDGTGGNTATSLHSTSQAGLYEVLVTWDPSVGSLGTAQYQIYDGATLLDTITVDQSVEPQNDGPQSGTYAGTTWHSLGRYSFASTAPKIVVSETGDGAVVADGFLLMDPDATETLHGAYDLVNRTNSEFGSDFWVDSLDHLELDETGGILLVRGDATAGWFAEDGNGGYITPAGSFTSLVKNGSTYELSHTDGTVDYFDADGLLTHREDRNGNRITYAYDDIDGDAKFDELVSITDAFGLTTTYAYGADDYLETVTDFADRATTYAIDTDGYVTQITRPDPDDDVATDNQPVTELYWYNLAGDVGELHYGKLKQVVLPEGNDTTITYDATGRFASANSADDTTWKLISSQSDGILTTTAQTPDDIEAKYFNERNFDTNDPLYQATEDNFVWTYTVDAFGYETSMTDPLDNTWLYQRDADGLVSTMVEPAGAGGTAGLSALTTNYDYDSRGNLLSIEYAQETLATDDGSAKITESWTYDPLFSQVTSYTDGRGFQTINELDANGNVETVKQQVDPTSTTYVNDPTKWITTEYFYTDPAVYSSGGDLISLPGGLVEESRDGRGVLTRYEYFDASGNNGTVPSNLDHHGLVRQITDGIVDGTEYAWANIVTFDTEDETSQSFEYDDARNLNQVTQVMDSATDRVTDYTYDNLDRLTQVTEAEASHIQPDGSPITARSITTYEYDKENFRTKMTDGLLDEWALDHANNTALARVTEYVPDEMLRLKKTILPEAPQYDPSDPGADADGMVDAKPEIENFYDAAGNLTSTDDALDRTVVHTYDARNLLSTTTLPDPDPNDSSDHGPSTTTYAYDSIGNLKSVKDALHEDGVTDRETTYVYDALHRQTLVTYPAPGVHPETGTQPHDAPFMTYVYDDSNNIVEEQDALQTDGANRTTKYEFDGLGRNTKITQPKVADSDNNGAMTNPVTVIEYDAASNVTNGKDAKGNDVVFDYDALGRLSQVTREATDDHDSPVTRTLYNDAGQAIEVRELLPNDSYRSTFSEYDDLGRLEKVEEPEVLDPNTQQLAKPTTTYEYDRLGKLRKTTDADEGITAYYYDDLDRQIARAGAKDTSKDAPDLDQVDFDADAADALRDAGYTVHTTAFDVANQRQQTVEYTNNDGAGANRTTDYEYDQQGRLVKVEQPNDGNGRQTNTYVFDAVGNQLEVHETINGSTTNVTTNQYDNLNRLVKTTLPKPDSGDPTNPIMTYVYDIASRTTQFTDTLGRVTEQVFDALNRTVKSILPAVVVDVIDQNDTGFTTGGSANAWADSGSASGAHQGTQKELAGGTGDGVADTNTATWTFDDIEDGKTYELYITWNGTGGEDTVPVTITHDGTTTPVVLDQSVAPTGFTSHNRNWVLLGTVTDADSASDIVVKMTDDFALNVDHDELFADAVMLVDTAPVVTQEYDLVSNVTGYVDALGRVTNYVLDELYRVIETQAPTTTHVDPTDGSTISARATTTTTHDVLGRVEEFTDALARVTSYTYDALDRTLTTVLPSVGGSSPVWTNTYSLYGDLLTSTDPEGNTTSYTYTSDHQQRTVEYPVSSDAPLYDDAIDDDNGGGDFSTTGTWTYDDSSPTADNSYDGDTGTGDPDYTISDGTGGNEATWDFGNLPEGGRYEVYATWDNALGGGNAEYKIFDGTALELTTAAIDQSSQPDDDYDFGDGYRWQSLGEFTFAAGTASVVLSEFDNGGGTYDQVVADGVRIRQIPPQTETIYNEAGEVISHTDELGRTTTYEYDDRGRV
ncbi:MAG: DUF642 domain-containing protein, partial [Pirellulales bacterium]|nr:DUF642 domain-containing protein [Pirellulales bacterium]